ncbi:MAG: 16S rRNA (cytosine(1402)-N(4))-methyltransferase RsmH [Thermodesulfobacteriota bacterium]
MGYAHRPVMCREVIEYLCCRGGGIYLDGTLGGGGHGQAILEASGPDGLLIGLDRDEAAICHAGEELRGYKDRVILIRANFSEVGEELKGRGISEIDGMLLDLGVSSYHLDEAERGFSFRLDAPLDMRMDRRGAVTAKDLLNTLTAKELAAIIRDYGEERFAMRIARAIVRAREIRPLSTTGELSELIAEAIPRRFHGTRIHPATRTFQALRIAVNDELGALKKGLTDGIGSLKSGGRMVVISYHSLEDRIVKNFFKEEASPCRCPAGLPLCLCGEEPRLKLLTGRVVTASASEIENNPRARSAKLRAIEKI